MKFVNDLGNKVEHIAKKGYIISYVANTAGNGAFRGDTTDETALIVNSEYFILNGDHRAEYKKCKNLAACMKYFKSRPKLKSSWSN